MCSLQFCFVCCQKSAGPVDFASELAKKLGAPGPAPAQDSDEEGEPVMETKETKRKG
jgi:hypothetical protein